MLAAEAGRESEQREQGKTAGVVQETVDDLHVRASLVGCGNEDLVGQPEKKLLTATKKPATVTVTATAFCGYRGWGLSLVGRAGKGDIRGKRRSAAAGLRRGRPARRPHATGPATRDHGALGTRVLTRPRTAAGPCVVSLSSRGRSRRSTSAASEATPAARAPSLLQLGNLPRPMPGVDSCHAPTRADRRAMAPNRAAAASPWPPFRARRPDLFCERAEEFASGGKLGARPARGVFGGT